MYAIQLEGVQKSFGNKHILSNCSLTINQGEMVAITGASGSGKTTLLNMIGLIEPISNGAISIFNNSNIKPNSSKANKIIREHICYLFQNYALISNETVLNNLMLALKYVKVSDKEKRARVSKALKEVGLSGYEKTPVFSLSGGEQQRVAVARILVNPKKLVLADEPTGSLDQANRDLILSYLKKFHEQGITVIIVTHDPAVAAQCPRVFHVENGNIAS